jgi:hypothetical protein
MSKKKKIVEVEPADQFLVYVFENEEHLTRVLDAVVERLKRNPDAKDAEVCRHHGREVFVGYLNVAAMQWCMGVPDLPSPRWAWARKELLGLERDQLFPALIDQPRG